MQQIEEVKLEVHLGNVDDAIDQLMKAVPSDINITLQKLESAQSFICLRKFKSSTFNFKVVNKSNFSWIISRKQRKIVTFK